MGTSSPADFEAVLRGDAQTGSASAPNIMLVVPNRVLTASIGYQLASLVAFPAYVAFTLFRKRGFNLNRTLRATWLAGVGGAGAGAGYGWYESTKGDNYLRERHIALIYDVSRFYFLCGAVQHFCANMALWIYGSWVRPVEYEPTTTP